MTANWTLFPSLSLFSLPCWPCVKSCLLGESHIAAGIKELLRSSDAAAIYHEIVSPFQEDIFCGKPEKIRRFIRDAKPRFAKLHAEGRGDI